jgi:hypothetical protein
MGQLTAAIQVGANGMIAGTIDYVRPILLAAITAWIAFQAINVANGFAPMSSLYRGTIRAAVVVFLLQSAANYNQYVTSLAQAIPTEVGNALAAVGANRGNVANGAAFDDVWNTAAKAGLVVFEHIPKYSLSSIPLLVRGHCISSDCLGGNRRQLSDLPCQHGLVTVASGCWSTLCGPIRIPTDTQYCRWLGFGCRIRNTDADPVSRHPDYVRGG